MAQVAKGLEGVVVAATGLSEVDGENGRLIYVGYDIADLANNATFEEVVYLLWHGHLPNPAELSAFGQQLARFRTAPDAVRATLRSLPASTEPLDALRTTS